ncbi:MAG: DNA-binding protein [Desulfobulbaceae bacterium]|nr:MAG: DNA-binding protein [Desulfobulbaceae bacterium]
MPIPCRNLIAVLSLLLLLAYPLAGVAASDPSPPAHAPAGAGSGQVIETMNASGYTYLLVDSGKEQTWVAIPETTVSKGATVQYAAGMVMQNFHSKTLDRTFASIVFSPGLEGTTTGSGEQSAEKTGTASSSFAAAVEAEKDAKPAPMSTSGGSLGAIVPFSEIKVEKAGGAMGHTVQEIFGKAKELDGKTVQVRGKVMKINLGIMGRNWVHLQDGSGDPMTNTHDLVITTSESPAQGEILAFEGKLSADKDFGAGYAYSVIIEDAKIIP